MKPYCRNGHRRTTETTRTRYTAKGKPYQMCTICQAAASKRGKASARHRKRRAASGHPERHELVAAQWERLITGPETEYKRIMLEAKAEYEDWDRRNVEGARARQRRGVLGNQPGYLESPA